MISIAQWNMNGFFNNYHELQLLIKDNSPSIICIQETHLKNNLNPHTPKQYTGIFHNLPYITSSKQGISILIKKNINFKIINIISNISVLAIEINIEIKFTRINLYIPPKQTFSSSEILDILSQISTPVILVGDVNAWSTLRGSEITNDRGRALEDVILSSNLVILNNGLPTHFSTHKTFTNVDISLVSVNLATICEWKILKNFFLTDTIVTLANPHLNLKRTAQIGQNSFR